MFLPCYNPQTFMKSMKRLIFISIFFTVLLLTTFIAKTSADGGCVPVYGGGVSCPKEGQVLIDKKVRNPSTGIFVDNLGLADPKYRPLWIVTFRLYVKNSGNQTLDRVIVTDKIPQFVDFMSGPGNYDAGGRTLTFTVSNLLGGSTRTFDIKGRIVHQAVLPAEKSIICPVNVAEAQSDSQKDRDESQFCVEKEMVVPTVPKAGPEHWILSAIGLSTVFVTGVYLRKKALISR